MLGFKSTGIWPFNPKKCTAEDFEAANQCMSIVFEENLQSSSYSEPGSSTSHPFGHPKENVEPSSSLDSGPSASHTSSIVHSNRKTTLKGETVSITELSPLTVLLFKGKTKKGIK